MPDKTFTLDVDTLRSIKPGDRVTVHYAGIVQEASERHLTVKLDDGTTSYHSAPRGNRTITVHQPTNVEVWEALAIGQDFVFIDTVSPDEWLRTKVSDTQFIARRKSLPTGKVALHSVGEAAWFNRYGFAHSIKGV